MPTPSVHFVGTSEWQVQQMACVFRFLKARRIWGEAADSCPQKTVGKVEVVGAPLQLFLFLKYPEEDGAEVWRYSSLA